MDDLVDRLRRLEEDPAPDVWDEIERRTDLRRGGVGSRPARRWAAGILAAMIGLAGIGFLLAVFRPFAVPPAAQLPTARDVTLIPLGGVRNWNGGPMVAGDGAVWIVGSGAERPYELLRIDPGTLEVTDRISLGFADAGLEPAGLAVGDGSVWISVRVAKDGRWDLRPGELLRVDEATGTVADRYSIAPNPSGLAVANGSVWLAEASGDVARIDPSTGRVIDEVRVGDMPRAIVPAFGSLWVTRSYGEGSLVRLDPASGRIEATFPDVTNISAGSTGVWVQGQGEPNGAIRLIDPATDAFVGEPIGLQIQPAYVAEGGGQTWLAAWVADPSTPSDGVIPGFADPGTFTVSPIDPDTGEPLGDPIDVCQGSPGQPVIAYGGLWFPCASELFHLRLSPPR
jgi:hypothetical protein